MYLAVHDSEGHAKMFGPVWIRGDSYDILILLRFTAFLNIPGMTTLAHMIPLLDALRGLAGGRRYL